MRNISIALAIFLLPTLCRADSNANELAALIAKTVDEGHASIENPAMARKLGLTGENLVIQTVEVGPKESRDGQNHYISVFVHPAKDGPPVAYAFTLGNGTVKQADGQLFVEGFIFLADPGGNLQKAFHNSGLAHHLKSEELPIGKRKTRKLFEKELDFFLAREK